MYFPLTGSGGPAGTYEYFVCNNHNDPDPARPYGIYIYEGQRRITSRRGTVENGVCTPTFEYEFAG